MAVDPLRVIAFFVACADMATQSIRVISLVQMVNINLGLKYALRDVVQHAGDRFVLVDIEACVRKDF